MIINRAVTSPSNFFRRRLCPGSELAELGMMDDSESQAAAAGTLAHYHDANPDEELATLSLEEALKINKQLRERYLKFMMERLEIPEDAERKEIVEQEYFLRDENGDMVKGPDDKELKGHPDRLIFFPKYRILFVFDSKFGRKKVASAEANYQIRLYCIMAADPDYGDFEVTKVFGAITQPFASPQLHAVEYDMTTLRDAKRECLHILRTMRATPDPVREPSPDACEYCRARATCSAAHALVKQAAEQKISELPIPELEGLAPTMELAETITKAYWTRIKYIAENYPDQLSKFELKPGANVAEIPAEQSGEAYSKLSSAGILDAQQFTAACKPSITKLAEIAAKRHEIPVKEARFRIETVLGETVHRKQKAPSVVEKKIQPLLKS